MLRYELLVLINLVGVFNSHMADKMKYIILPHFNPHVKVTGIYTRKADGRKIVCEMNSLTKKNPMKTFARYLAEQHLEEYLPREIEVDHKDRNKLNDNICNLQIIHHDLHAKLDQKHKINNELKFLDKSLFATEIKINQRFQNKLNLSFLFPTFARIKKEKVKKQFVRLPYFDNNFYALSPFLDKSSGRYCTNIINKTTKVKRHVTFARYLMENKVKRILNPNETVDHIDQNKLNDDINNLQILSLSEHVSLDVKRVKLVNVLCVGGCNSLLQRKHADIKSAAKKGRAGPFCNLCRKKYQKDILSGKKKLSIQTVPKAIYYTNKS